MNSLNTTTILFGFFDHLVRNVYHYVLYFIVFIYN